jgi:energy-coupling factor transporter ATP-binding protein EcfA2
MNNLLLSGGQQSVVALALIFSIQQCDPMPFYVFDEIDASLDPTYRMQVAKFIKDMSHHPTSPCQFICTTFREEIVKVADAWFLVEFRNDMSVVTSSDKTQSLKVGFYSSFCNELISYFFTCTDAFVQLILDEKKHSDRSGGGAAEPSAVGRSKRVRAAAISEDKENFDGDD